ncbi:cilia- and flagella-associated protein 57-like [Procambarus clarkii]|uniref:cilia- and flagella-associated protein 57-like n=1 Tax=Procambarus clarkii TaxID=6728 RepID=UPI003743AF92
MSEEEIRKFINSVFKAPLSATKKKKKSFKEKAKWVLQYIDDIKEASGHLIRASNHYKNVIKELKCELQGLQRELKKKEEKIQEQKKKIDKLEKVLK